MNLIALEFRPFERRRVENYRAAFVDLLRKLEGTLGRKAEQLPKHTDNVLVRVLVIVQEKHVIGRLPLDMILSCRSNLRRQANSGFGCRGHGE